MPDLDGARGARERKVVTGQVLVRWSCKARPRLTRLFRKPDQQTMVAAAIRQAFLQADPETARQTWRHVADRCEAAGPSSPG